MKRIAMLLSLMFFVSFLFAAAGRQGSVDTYPERDIRFIVPFAPGSANDLLSRKIGEILRSEGLVRRNITTTVMSGGNTADAINAVMDAAPDGYTFLLHHSNFITNHLSGNLRPSYEDMTLVAGVAEVYFAILARANDNRWNNAIDFARDAKANPEKYIVGYVGYASPGHFSLLQYLALNGASDTVVQVPYPSSPDATAAQLGNHADITIATLPNAMPYLRSGDLKLLGVCALERDPMFPDVISLKDMGSDRDGIKMRYAFFAPKNTPDNVVQKFCDMIRHVANTPAFVEYCDFNNFIWIYRNSAEIKKAYDDDTVILRDLIRTLSR